MKKNSFFIVFSLFAFAIDAQLQQLPQDWKVKYDNFDSLKKGAAFLTGILSDNNNNLYTTGHFDPNYVAMNDFMVTNKYSSDGRLQWSQTIDSAVNGAYYSEYFPCPPMSICKDGSVYVTGYKKTIASSSHKGFLIKYDPDGNTSWKRDLDSGNYSGAYFMGSGLAVDNNDNVYVTNPIDRVFESFPGQGVVLNKTAISKFNSKGDKLWSQVFLPPAIDSFNLSTYPSDIIIGPDGNIYVTGYIFKNYQSQASAYYDFYVLKYSADGVLLYYAHYGQIDSGLATALYAHSLVNANGDVYTFVVGFGGSLGPPGMSDGQSITKWNSSGMRLWTKPLSAPPINMLSYDQTLDASGNIYLTGRSVEPLQLKYAITKLDSSANIIWQTFPSDSNGCGKSIKFNSCGQLYTTGQLSSYNGLAPLVITKQDAENGSFSLNQVSLQDTLDYTKLAVNANGSVYIGAQTTGSHYWSWGKETGRQSFNFLKFGGTDVQTDFSSTNNCSLNASFSNQSENNVANWNWNFGDGETSTEQNPSHTYSAPGTYTVILITSTNNCSGGEASKQVIINQGELNIKNIPNIFTPNGDGNNDEFKIDSGNSGTFEIKIYDRWGKEMYKGSADGAWDGKYKNESLPEGVYFYTISGDECESKKNQKSGTITVLK